MFTAAPTEVTPGSYTYYENEKIPGFLLEDQQNRTPSAYNCKLLVATAWGGGAIGGIEPNGVVYLVYDFSDHRHDEGDYHFNKEVKVYYKDQKGIQWRLTMNREVDKHYVNAIETGTSLPVLRTEFALPKESKGKIQYLIDNGTSIDPYPSK